MGIESLGRVYVTGADGFIGSHLTERLVQAGLDVTALCVYNSMGSYGWLQQYAVKTPKNLTLVLGDIRDAYFMQRQLKDHNTVFHLAALIAIPYSYVAPQSYVSTNIMGTLNVMQAALEAGCSRVVHTSTSEVYGTALFTPITELHPLQGQSPYSASKIGADKMVEAYVRSFDLPATTLRPFNTYGPRQSLRAVLPTIIAQLLAGQNELELGSTTPTRDFNYVTDTAEAFVSVAAAPLMAVKGEVFNTGTGYEISIGEVAALAARVLKKDVKIICKADRQRPANSEVERLISSAAKLTQATEWQPRVPLEEGIIKFAEWLKTHSPQSIELAKKYHT